MLGATFETRGNWLIPSRYGSATDDIDAHSLWVADISALTKIYVSGDVDSILLHTGYGAVRPLTVGRGTAGGIAARPAQDWALLVLEPSVEEEQSARNEQEPAGTALSTNLTSGYAAFVVGGRELSGSLHRSLTVNVSQLKAGTCIAASWARIPSLLLVREDFDAAVELYVATDYGRYAWDTLIGFGASPVGWDAIERMAWRP